MYPMTPVQIDAILRLVARESGLRKEADRGIIDEALTAPVVKRTQNAKRPFIELPEHHVLVRLDRAERALLVAMNWGSSSLRDELVDLHVTAGLRMHLAKRAKTIRRGLVSA